MSNATNAKKDTDQSNDSKQPVGHKIIVSSSVLPENHSDQTDEPEQQAKSEISQKHEINITPPSDFIPPKSSDQPAAKVVDSQPSKSALSDVAASPKVNKPAVSPKPSRDDLDKSDKENGDSGNNEESERRKQEMVIRKRQEAIELLVNSKRFFLPIESESDKESRHVIIGVAICLILVVAWLDVALDAGLINNSFHLPHTHFFSIK